MPITQQTPDDEINRYIAKRLEQMKSAIVRNLCYVGEMCRNEAIQKHKYINQTHNLESSTGYVVTADGQIMQMGGFEVSNGGYEGKVEGEAFARKLANEATSGYCLILVAGMNYAKFVSDMGLDVLDSAELVADRIVPQMMNMLNF